MLFTTLHYSHCVSVTTGWMSWFGNSLVMFVLYRQRSTLQPTDFLTLSLAVSDASISIFGYSRGILEIFNILKDDGYLITWIWTCQVQSHHRSSWVTCVREPALVAWSQVIKHVKQIHGSLTVTGVGTVLYACMCMCTVCGITLVARELAAKSVIRLPLWRPLNGGMLSLVAPVNKQTGNKRAGRRFVA